MLDITASQLCLSEDHAYERHQFDPKDASTIGTCEVAIPGRTKRDQAKRAKEIESTFEDTKESKPYLTPESSWLYMASNPVVCETDAMALVAVVGNINCTIEESRGKGHFFESGQLYVLKREMLWVLHDQGHMKKFPFGLMELGNCEEHRGSPRSSEWVEVPDIKEPILVNEQLFLNAIRVSQEVYNDAQVYPYYYAGHYHKDAGKSGADQEGRFVESLKMYAQGARITSKYPYELQLNKHITTMSMLILDDILMSEDKEPRKWVDSCNAIDCCMWLLVFFDSLLFWEESQHQREQVSVSKSGINNGRGSGGTKQQFVEILVPSHPQSIGKLLACFDQEIRTQALLNLHSSTRTSNDDGRYEAKLRSKRLQNGSLLCKGVIKPKVTIREMDLAIILEEDDEMSGGRRSKRTRRG